MPIQMTIDPAGIGVGEGKNSKGESVKILIIQDPASGIAVHVALTEHDVSNVKLMLSGLPPIHGPQPIPNPNDGQSPIEVKR
jgi:hypothetical protein